jgi:hypothetical protein
MEVKELWEKVPHDFDDASKVWIYQSSRPFSNREIVEINDQLHHFYTQWMSHGAPVKGWASVVFDRYIIMMADETENVLGGCSMDDAQRVIKSLERQYQVKLFDRLTLSFYVKEKIEMLPFNQVQYALDKGFISGDTLMFNNLVATKHDLLHRWIVPMSTTWLAGKVQLTVA